MEAEPQHTVRRTRAEFNDMGARGLFAGRRVELIDGEIVEMTPQGTRHATVVTLASRALQRVFERPGAGNFHGDFHGDFQRPGPASAGGLRPLRAGARRRGRPWRTARLPR